LSHPNYNPHTAYPDIFGRLYRKIPPVIRYGKLYQDTYNFLNISEYWPREKFEEYQLYQLKDLMRHAYNTVPYYTDLMDEHGIHPDSIHDFEDFKKLPILTKDEIRKNPERFISTQYQRKHMQTVSTSGSTGNQLTFMYERGGTLAKERAFIKKMFDGFGVKSNDRSVVIRGTKERMERIRFNRFNNTLYIINPVFNKNSIVEYAGIISAFNPNVIKGYPSYIFVFAKYLQSHPVNKSFSELKLILCHSEKLYNFQHEVIINTFGVPVFTQYGMTEMCVFMNTCPAGRSNHVVPQYGYIEIIPDPAYNGSGHTGKIIATGFNNYAFPFIRYDTGDIGSIPDTIACRCGRNYLQVKDIIGRTQDFLKANSESHISPIEFDYMVASLKNYIDIQLVQHNPDTLELRIVPDDNYQSGDEDSFVSRIKKRFNNNMHIKISHVDSIERTPGNKKLFVRSAVS
jgi:phenylacetate-CoA ligase